MHNVHLVSSRQRNVLKSGPFRKTAINAFISTFNPLVNVMLINQFIQHFLNIWCVPYTMPDVENTKLKTIVSVLKEFAY